MQKTITYIKQSNNSAVAHVYEHVIANHITRQLLGHKNYQLIDYELNADTYDGIIVLRITTDSAHLVNVFNKIILTPYIPLTEIEIAVEQIQCEYERSSDIDITKLSDTVKSLHKSPWTKREDFTISQPVSDEARTLTTQLGRFRRRIPQSFDHFDVTYTITDCPFELKTLGVYCLQIIGLNFIDKIYIDFKYCYDAGDQWAEYQSLAGYPHIITARKARNFSQKDFQKLLDKFLQTTIDDNFITKTRSYIEKDLSNPFPYFNQKSLYAKSYHVIGDKDLKQMVSEENVRLLFKKITATVVKL
ncbi:hypothetical protein FJZ39_00540 [Candidatus Saccharibacteria bacterium]|nr:hypothetical protein [Candidatus Saccharibacteria bacterium]